MVKLLRLASFVLVLPLLACDGMPTRPAAGGGADGSTPWRPSGSRHALSDGAYTTIVHPTGQHPTDLDNVQAAVDAGGSVLLKATDASGVPTAFDFGPGVWASGWVELTTDVWIAGESVDGARTTIVGGGPSFLGLVPVRSAIRDVLFAGPGGAAVYLLATAGFELSDSRVQDVVPLFFYTDPNGVDVYKAQAVWVQPRSLTSLSGTISIVDNEFVDAGLGGAILGYGLAIIPLHARVVIARNVIDGANLAGIFLAFNSAEMVVEDNVIVPGPGDIPNRAWGNGVHVLGTTEGGTVAIRDNQIRVGGPQAHGVFMFGDEVFNGPIDGAVVAGNGIDVEAALAGVGMWGSVSNSVLERNRVRGTAELGVGVLEGFFDPTEPASDNVLLGNQLEQAELAFAGLYLGANTFDHVVAGHTAGILDLGTGNQITGSTTALPKHIGAAIAAARDRLMGQPGVMSEPGPEWGSH